MEASDQDITLGRAAEPAALLAAYLDAGCGEAAFVALVDRVAGLVLASAQRRTGDAALDAALDSIPERDRSVLIARFFDRRRFDEIAYRTGKSETACKVQVKRALEKLASLLRARGVALSASALASGLASEFANAAPVAAPALAGKALAASGKISATTLFTNTLLTMSPAKPSAITAAAIVAIGLVPLLQLKGKAARIQSEIATLESAPAVAPLSNETPSRRPPPRQAAAAGLSAIC